MEVVIAGWIAGYAMALVLTPALVFVAARAASGGFLSRWLGPETPATVAVIPLVMFGFLGWPVIGIGLAVLYRAGGFAERPDFLGAPSGPFVLFSAALGLVPAAFLCVVAAGRWWLWLALGAAFTGVVGWALPIMAGS